MKKVLLLMIASGLALAVMAQLTPYQTTLKSDYKVLMPSVRIDDGVVGQQQPNQIVSTKAALDDPIVINSIYDMQTNSSQQNRLFRFGDGTMGGVCTMSPDDNPFTNRGSGYNYYDGTNWGTPPAARVETVRTGWPSYLPYGAGGEMIIAHQSGTTPLIISKRATKGAGAWTQSELAAPSGAAGLLWPRVVSNGPDNMYIHIICMTSPTGNGGVVYQGLDGALVYNRSLDGGTTWGGWEILDGMTSTEYPGFNGDAYAWAEPMGETLCFTVGDSWQDQFIMKSTDNGDNWTKTMIWSCPWNFWAGPDTTGIFYCSDGCNAVALDLTGKAHVLFGLQRAMGDATGAKFWYPFTDGLIYWNEDMPELPQDLDPDVLYANGNYIGWVLDTMVFYQQIEELAHYYNSLSSMPTLVVDQSNFLYAIWAGVTTLKDPNSFMLRHIFMRASTDGGVTWKDTIMDLTGDFLYTWSECVYPFAAPNPSDMIYVLFQEDDEGGIYVRGLQGAQGQTGPTTNNLTVLSTDVITGVNEKYNPNITATRIFPNPVHGTGILDLTLKTGGNLTVVVSNVVGQKVMEIPMGFVNAGPQQIRVDASQLTKGAYFVTIKLNNESVTSKMIVE
jgi:hypothetical protein